jgi:very-short-patch-repair endonuclease
MIISKEYPNFFDGITESPIECDFAYMLCKILKPGIIIESQVGFSTRLGDFRGDFVLETSNLKVLIELDGKEYHKDTKDNWRDSFILGKKKVDLIIRFKRKDIVYNLIECCFILNQQLPDFFTERSKTNLINQLEPKNISEIQAKIKDEKKKYMDIYCFSLTYFDEKEIDCQSILEMHYKSVKEGYWLKYYNYARNKSIFEIDSLTNHHVF